MSSLISLRGVTKEFPADGVKNSLTAVDSVDLDVERGEVLGVIGYSGAGKSTLVRLINGLEWPTRGSVTVDGSVLTDLSGSQLRALRGRVGMIFQQFNLFSSRTVAGNVGYPLKLAGWPAHRRVERVQELLEFVGIQDKASQYPAQLSGGQKQRVGIARALATRPPILLADEATSALDPETTRDVLALLLRINRELGTTIVVITHEMDVVSAICDTVAVMEAGRIIEHGPVYETFSDPRQPTTRRLVRGVWRDRPTPEALERLRQTHQGRLVTVPIRHQGPDQAAFAGALQRSGVSATIVYGGIGELAGKPFGSLTYALDGDRAAVEEAIAALARLAPVDEAGKRTEAVS